ncbi:MAG: biosynthetic peptidoglycan transglycosylase [Acutalibacteraceae bacterium]|nr:biosynthetic peptidoglycan transglycosylase [Acutalibacteraceae bacterium]
MKKLIKKTVATILAVALLIGIGICAYYTAVGYSEYKKVISEKPLDERVAEIVSQESFVKKEELPQIYINAVIAAEDHNFYSHGAVSFVSTFRAVITNLKDREFTEGGSTITQQVAKNMYFSQEKKIERKVAEMFVAFDLEKKYDKDEIFELYVNNIFFGNGYYNIYDASVGYYGVEPKALTDSQATILAGVPNAPSVYSPNNNSPLTKQRQKQVLDSMVKYGYINRETADEIFSES